MCRCRNVIQLSPDGVDFKYIYTISYLKLLVTNILNIARHLKPVNVLAIADLNDEKYIDRKGISPVPGTGGIPFLSMYFSSFEWIPYLNEFKIETNNSAAHELICKVIIKYLHPNPGLRPHPGKQTRQTHGSAYVPQSNKLKTETDNIR